MYGAYPLLSVTVQSSQIAGEKSSKLAGAMLLRRIRGREKRKLPAPPCAGLRGTVGSR
jgi:hypothetical protein